MNTNRERLIKEAREKESAFWTRVADDLAKAGRNRRIVNLSRISRVAEDGETVVVPGKVLGDGELGRKVTIVAYSFSESARVKLNEAKCPFMTIDEFMTKNPKGTGRIIG